MKRLSEMKMMNKVLMAIVTLTSTPSFATMVFQCIGETQKETLQFSVSDSEGLQIDQVSKALCGGYYSISKGDEGAWLSANAHSTKATMVKYDTLEDNWSFALSIPSKISDGDSMNKFQVNYRFDYSDLDQVTVKRKLDCMKVNN